VFFGFVFVFFGGVFFGGVFWAHRSGEEPGDVQLWVTGQRKL
jgi:hypothetical protein